MGEGSRCRYRDVVATICLIFFLIKFFFDLITYH